MLRWTVVTVAATLAVVAAVGLVAVVTRDEERCIQPTLVATTFIPAGTSGTVVFAEGSGMYERGLTCDEMGSISDPAYASGRVTTRDVEPGENLLSAFYKTQDDD